MTPSSHYFFPSRWKDTSIKEFIIRRPAAQDIYLLRSDSNLLRYITLAAKLLMSRLGGFSTGSGTTSLAGDHSSPIKAFGIGSN